MKYSKLIILAVLGLSACGAGKAASLQPATPATTVAPATTQAPTTAAPTTMAAPTTTEAPTTTVKPECQNGATEPRNVTSEGYDRYRCVHEKWAFDLRIDTPKPTAPPTTAAPKKGTRSNPFDLRADAPGGPDMLDGANYAAFFVANLRPVDMADVLRANRYNDPAPDGKHYMALTYVVGLKAEISETLSGYNVECDLVGSKAKVYTSASLSDTKDVLHLLRDQPDAIGGGGFTGDVIYAVDDDDTDFMVLCDRDTFIIPG